MAAPRNEDLRQQILSGASALLESQSFSEISLMDIARAAQVSRGTLYYYYKSKNDLLCDIADQYIEGLFRELMAWVDNKSKDTSLPRMLRYIVTYGVNDPGRGLRLYLTAEAVSGNEQIRVRLLNKYHVFRTVFAEKIAERAPAADSEFDAWLILAVIDGLLIQNLLHNEEIDLTAFIDQFIGRIGK